MKENSIKIYVPLHMLKEKDGNMLHLSLLNYILSLNSSVSSLVHDDINNLKLTTLVKFGTKEGYIPPYKIISALNFLNNRFEYFVLKTDVTEIGKCLLDFIHLKDNLSIIHELKQKDMFTKQGIQTTNTQVVSVML